MATLAGNAGAFKVGTNTVAEMDTWSLDVSPGLEETQSFGDTWKERTLTLKEYSGSASGRLDITDTNGHVAIQTAILAGTVIAARFYVNGSNYYSGNVFVNAAFSAPENGLITANYTFTGHGALTYT